MQKIQREVRHKRIQNNRVVLTFDNDGTIESKIQDISLTGMCLKIDPPFCSTMSHKTGDLSSLINFRISDNQTIKNNGRITRCEENGQWVGIKFDNPLNPSDLNAIRGREACSYEMCKTDKNIVMTEAHQIKTCSSNYFIWTIGLLLPLISGIWTLVLQNKIDAPACSGAMLAIFLVFCMSIFSNLEKTRAIYKRESFVAALDTFLVRGEAPNAYKGWTNLKYNLAECVAKRCGGGCSKGLSKFSKKTCKHIGLSQANILLHKKVIHSILDSFVSLTSVFYCILYSIIIILSAISIARLFSSPGYDIAVYRILKFFAFGFLLGFFVIGRNAQILFATVFLTIIGFTIGAINPEVSLPVGVFSIDNVYIVFVSLAIGFILGSVGNILMAQLIQLRKRQYSFESQFFMWLEILNQCESLPDYEVALKTNHTPTSKLLDDLVEFIFFGRRKEFSLQKAA